MKRNATFVSVLGLFALATSVVFAQQAPANKKTVPDGKRPPGGKHYTLPATK